MANVNKALVQTQDGPTANAATQARASAAATLGDRVICQRCGATYVTYGFDTCTAALDERCEGFETVEAVVYGIARTGDRRP